ncbi:MAG: hypothetical protein SO424_04850 [[Pasteurella] aerogenes]|nr:hypothetical protein [[Pasteurella] aerogenes]
MKITFLLLVLFSVFLFEPLFYFPFMTGCQYFSIDDPSLNRITCDDEIIWGVDNFIIRNGYLIIFAHHVDFGEDGLSPNIGNEKKYFVYHKENKKTKEMNKLELISWAKDEKIDIPGKYLE